jgi:tRNA-Thr(GGU) m(6)t(6)A37 methyltransferase TsaA
METQMPNDNGKTQTFQLHPIGYVRASDAEQSYILQIDEPFRPALKQLEQFSHVLIFWWADQMDAEQYRQITTTQLPYAPGVEAGVFACRSEYRPNPIALTTMMVLHVDVESGVVVLPWIDAFDGTPVLDLKPYIPISDRIRDFKVAEWLSDWPEWMEDAGAYFAEHAVDFGE